MTFPNELETRAVAERPRDITALVAEHLDFVWRSLRRLGVREADCDDGCQRVWMVLAKHCEHVEPGKVRSYVFSVVLRVASEMRRRDVRHNQWQELDNTAPLHYPDQNRNPEQSYERQQGLETLDALLSAMSWELRTAFVMYELEGFSSVEIAQQLGVSRGTVASRLRLARDAFHQGLARLRADEDWPRASGDDHG